MRGCDHLECLDLNTWSAGLDVVWALLFFFVLREFRKYASMLAELDGEQNVRVEDYSIEYVAALKGTTLMLANQR